MEKIQTQIQQHPNNARIAFNKEAHTYHVDGERYQGVTGWISKYCKPFNMEEIAKKLTSYHPKYRHLDPQDLLDEWERARAYGDYVHDSVELYINYGIDSDIPELNAFKRFVEESGLTPVKGEWLVFNEDHKRASAIDVVCVNTDGEIVVVDIKTREDGIEYSSYQNKKMSFPLNSLPDSRFYKYSVQVNIYMDWVQRWGFKVAKTGYVLNLYQNTYEMIPVINLKNEVEKLYEFEKN